MEEKKRVVIWGTGNCANEMIEYKVLIYDYEILAFVDNNSEKWGKKFREYQIVSPECAAGLSPDLWLVWIFNYEEDIISQITESFEVNINKILTHADMRKRMESYLIEKYKNSDDLEIQKCVLEIKNNGLNIFGYYRNEWEKDQVFRDDEDWPYILFEGKRMYFPKSEIFFTEDGNEYVGGLMYEQGEGSPHKYITSDNEHALKGVIVDAGVREGNFALRYAEDASKIYLIEAEEEWMEALKRTFEPYKDKVVFCQKFLDSYDSDTTITIDSLVNEPIDFLKVDIEGYEVPALLGAKKTLENSSACCAICSYHKKTAKNEIESLLQQAGYTTRLSEGYMFFPFEDVPLEESGFRKGLVFADKREKENERYN